MSLLRRSVAAAFIVLGIAATALAQSYVPGQILVGYRADATAEQKAATEAAYGLVLLKDFPHIGVRHYRLPAGLAVESAIAALQQLPIVAYAEPNYLRRIRAAPNDPQFSEQWYLFNRGQVVNGKAGVPGDDINWLPAMDIFSGTKEVIVAVVDSGVALDHSDLISRVWIDPRDPVNGTDDDGNARVDDNMGWDFADEDRLPLDELGHGTLVASLIAAERNNGRYGAGVSPTARILALRIDLSSANIISAFTYAARRGARVVNASFGGGSYSASEHGLVQWLEDNGVLLVAAAGNDGGNNDVAPHYPASYPVPSVIAVAATGRAGTLAGFSNFGPTSVDIAAPGEDMFGASVNRATIFVEDFGAGAPGWQTGVNPGSLFNVPWGFQVAAGRLRAVDSPGGNYLPGVDSFFMSPPIQTNVGTQVSFVIGLALSIGDCTGLEVSPDDGRTWILHWAECGPVSLPIDHQVKVDLSSFDRGTFRLRFRFVSDGTFESDGVYVGRLEVTNLVPFVDTGAQFQFNDGTSFSAPLVAGAAALLWSQRPDLTVRQIRAAIIESAKPASGLAGVVASGGKLDVFAALQAAMAVPPGLVLSTDAIDFGRQGVGATTGAQTVTLRNAGGVPLTFLGMTTTNDSVFPIGQDCPVLAPGAACILAVRFVPEKGGEVSGVVTIASTAPGSPHVVNVLGVGTPLGSPGAGGPPAGVIAATPNLCVASSENATCSSAITWTTQNVSAARVYVVEDGIEALFASALECAGQSCTAPWIRPEHTYQFTLYDYSSGSRGATLAAVAVNAASQGSPSPGGGSETLLPVPREIPDMSREVPPMPRPEPSLPREVPAMPRPEPSLPREVPTLAR